MSILNSDYLQHVLNNLQDGIFIADMEGKALWVNDMSTKQLGLSKEDLIGKHVDELEKQGIFTPSVTSDVIKYRKQSSIVQESLGRQYLATGKIIFIPEENKELIVVHVKDITSTVKSSLKLEKAEYLLKIYWEELKQMKHDQNNDNPEDLIIGTSCKHNQMIELINHIALYDASILLTGETGVGKSLLAEQIHRKSDRVDKPFMHINCSAIPETLLESELFGYKKGAFTGANQSGKVGLVEKADGGTLFLDEIAELPLPLQSKILQLVQDKSFIPVGATDVKHVDIRIITATNEDLLQLIEDKKFREDLYYRLNVVSIHVPSLREREEDILPLIYHYLNVYMLKYGKDISLTNDLLEALQEYSWPGNIRELENLVERLVVTAFTNSVDVDALPINMFNHTSVDKISSDMLKGQSLPQYLEKIERQIIQKAQQEYSSTRQAAHKLGLTQSSYIRRLQKYKLN